MPPSSAFSAASNPFLLAADGSPQLLPLLRSDPALVTKQDHTGYSLLHALVSYRHLDILRDLVAEFHAPLDLRDEDGETALFVAETVDAARCLVEELGGGLELVKARNREGQTSEEKLSAEIEEGLAEDSVTQVVEYLAEFRNRHERSEAVRGGEGAEKANDVANGAEALRSSSRSDHAPPLPRGVTLNVGTMTEDEAPADVDEDLRRRIEQLAARDDYSDEGGQQELKSIVLDAVRDMGSDNRDVRRRTD